MTYYDEIVETLLLKGIITLEEAEEWFGFDSVDHGDNEIFRFILMVLKDDTYPKPLFAPKEKK